MLKTYPGRELWSSPLALNFGHASRVLSPGDESNFQLTVIVPSRKNKSKQSSSFFFFILQPLLLNVTRRCLRYFELRPLYKKQNCLWNTVHNMQPRHQPSQDADRVELWDCSFLPFPSHPTRVFTKSNGACARELGFSSTRSLGHIPLIIFQAYRIVLQYHGAVSQGPTQKVTATKH